MPRKRARRSFSRIANKRAAERRAQQKRHILPRSGEHGHHEVIERLWIVEDVDFGEAEIERHAGPGAHPVIAPGRRAPLEGDVIEHLAEGDAAHREINAAQPYDQQAR